MVTVLPGALLTATLVLHCIVNAFESVRSVGSTRIDSMVIGALTDVGAWVEAGILFAARPVESL